MKEYVIIFGIGNADDKFAGNLVHKQFVPITFENGMTTEMPIQSILASRNSMHDFIDSFFDHLEGKNNES